MRWIVNHPLNRGRALGALGRWAALQARGRLGGAFPVPWLAPARLWAGPGLTSANAQFYVGLGDPDVMGFLLHVLRPGDLFVDAGANVGVMSVLAAGVVGAQAIAIEPIPATFGWLGRNLALNDLKERVEALNIALSDKAGEIRMTADQGAANRVTAGGDGIVIPAKTLDDVLGTRVPRIVKMDLEGFETPAVQGGRAALSRPGVLAIILEHKGHGRHYGHDEAALRRDLAEWGFRPFTYDPWSRTPIALVEGGRWPANVIFLRDVAAAQALAQDAPRRRLPSGAEL